MKFGTIFSFALCCFVISGASDVFGQSQSNSRPMKKQRQLTLGPVVNAASQVSINQINHSPWNTLLQKYVDGSGGVNYAGLLASAQDHAALDRYIATLSTASMQQPAGAEHQKAFWTNAYNAVTVKGILQEYPTTSIRNFTSETGGYNIWKQLRLNVGGQQLSLEDIEHKILRPMGDPRIHFGLVCASVGCPPLLNEAYVGEKLNDQLNKNEAKFFASSQNFQYDQARRQFKLSTIMQWYGSDFGPDQATQLRAIAPYLPTREAQAAANANAVSVSYLEYSWDLNEQAKPMAGSGTQAGSRNKMGSGSKRPAAGSGSR